MEGGRALWDAAVAFQLGLVLWKLSELLFLPHQLHPFPKHLLLLHRHRWGWNLHQAWAAFPLPASR